MKTAFAVFVVKPTGYIHSQVFTEVANSIHAGLLGLGYDAIPTDTPEVEDRRLIVVGPNLLPFARIHTLPEGTILYNLEQYAHWSNPFLRDPRYVLWDFSAENSRRLGLKPTAILPVGYCAGLPSLPRVEEKDIDVLFLGSPSPRRDEILNRMTSMGLVVRSLFDCYGPERDAIVARAKVQLNVHYAPGGLMEQPRLAYLLENRCTVLSEISSFEPENEEWSEACILAEYDRLPEEAEWLCHQSTQYRKVWGKRGYFFMAGRPIEKYLADALARTL